MSRPIRSPGRGRGTSAGSADRRGIRSGGHWRTGHRHRPDAADLHTPTARRYPDAPDRGLATGAFSGCQRPALPTGRPRTRPANAGTPKQQWSRWRQGRRGGPRRPPSMRKACYAPITAPNGIIGWPIITKVDRKIASSDTKRVNLGHGSFSKKIIQTAKRTA